MTYIGILFMKCVICLPSFAPNKFIHHILNPFGHQGFDFKFNNYVNFGQWPSLVTNKKSILPIINKYMTPRSNQAPNVWIFRFHSWMQVFGTTNPLIPCTAPAISELLSQVLNAWFLTAWRDDQDLTL